MARAGQAIQVPMDKAEETSQQSLPGEKLTGEVAYVPALNVARLKANGLQAFLHGAREGACEVHPFASPVAGKVALPAAQNVTHGTLPCGSHARTSGVRTLPPALRLRQNGRLARPPGPA